MEGKPPWNLCLCQNVKFTRNALDLLTSALWTPTDEITPHGRIRSKPIFSAGLIPTTSAHPSQGMTCSTAQTKHFTYDNVCASPFGQFLDSLLKSLAISQEIPWLSSERFGKVETRLYRVDCKQVLWLVILSIDKGAESDRAETKSSAALLYSEQRPYPQPISTTVASAI